MNEANPVPNHARWYGPLVAISTAIAIATLIVFSITTVQGQWYAWGILAVGLCPIICVLALTYFFPRLRN